MLGIAIVLMIPAVMWAQRTAQRRQAAQRRDYSEAEQQANVAAFGKKKRLAFWLGVLPLLSAVACGLWAKVALHGVIPTALLVVGTGLFTAGLGVVLIVFRCPVCGALPTGSGTRRGETLLLTPEECASCGARLK